MGMGNENKCRQRDTFQNGFNVGVMARFCRTVFIIAKRSSIHLSIGPSVRPSTRTTHPSLSSSSSTVIIIIILAIGAMCGHIRFLCQTFCFSQYYSANTRPVNTILEFNPGHLNRPSDDWWRKNLGLGTKKTNGSQLKVLV